MGLSCKPQGELRSFFSRMRNAEEKRHAEYLVREKNVKRKSQARKADKSELRK